METAFSQVYLFLILSFLIGGYVLTLISAWATVKRLDPILPAEFEGWHDPKEYARSQSYTRAKTNVGILSEPFGLAVLLAFLLAGGFNGLDIWLRGFNLGELVTGLLFLLILALAGDLISLPFDIYATFVLEERFGFNRTTPRTFVMDKIKAWLLTVVIGGPIVAGVILFFGIVGPGGWLPAWGFLALAVLALQYLAPVLILPLFNKFTPLVNAELRTAIEDYSRANGIRVLGVFVMDGSRRSTKGNALFTGFGSKKRIALFDTLLERHPTREIMAVLAHEAGHLKRRHVPKLLALSLLKLGLLLFLMSFFVYSRDLHTAFGMEHVSVYSGLLFFIILYTPASLLLSVGLNALSRKFEFQADGFSARTTGDPEGLVEALKRLSLDNLSNLTPARISVWLSYSHPPVLERIAALRGKVA